MTKYVRLALAGIVLALAGCGGAKQTSTFEVQVINADVAPAGAALILQRGDRPPATLGDIRAPGIIVPCGASATLTLPNPPPNDAVFDVYVGSTGRLAGGGPLGPFGSGHVVIYLTTGGPFTSPDPVATPPRVHC